MAEKTVNVVVDIRQTKGDPYRLIKRFTKKVKKERILEDVLAKRYYEKPSSKRRREKAKKIRNARKAEAARNKKLDIRQVIKMAVDAKTEQPIFGRYSVGLNHVGSYQASGTPWITGSTITADAASGSVDTYELPMVAKSITVQIVPNDTYAAPGSAGANEPAGVVFFFGESLAADGSRVEGKNSFPSTFVGAPAQMANRHVWSVRFPSGSHQVGTRVDKINIAAYAGASAISASYQIYAELTNIPEARMPYNYISGSGVNT